VIPGFGGRTPVAWIGADPNRHDKLPCRRPVVAILDTGVGEHAWLADGVTVVPPPRSAQPERTGVVHNPLEGVLDSDSGHGTFIAGLVRQTCPDADIYSMRIMGSDGYVEENLMVNAILELWIEQSANHLIDVLSMSFGYFHEAPEDVSTDATLLGPLSGLADLGVLIVAAAGNNSTTRPMFPAAFSRSIPVISVGAKNPNGSVALFSNSGDWVEVYEIGASVVSTLPVSFNASLQPTARVDSDTDCVRETIDPDDFSGGFATWSGTSFAAPIVAGKLARWLLDHRDASAAPDQLGSPTEARAHVVKAAKS
jgi:subtilisin family serine protease